MPLLSFFNNWLDRRVYETGIDRVVLYIDGIGYPWSGVTAVSETSDGGEPSPIYADNKEYVNLLLSEEKNFTIEAYTYPPEFEDCFGRRSLIPGFYIDGQSHKNFGLCFRTLVCDNFGTQSYKLHIYWNCVCKIQDESNQTISDSVEALTYSWDIDTTPVFIDGNKPTSGLIIECNKINIEKLANIENILYGNGHDLPVLPDIQDLINLCAYDFGQLYDSSGKLILDSNNQQIDCMGLLEN